MTNNKILGMLGLASRARKITFGTDSTLIDLETGKVKLILIAEDASDRTKRKITDKARHYNVPVIIHSNIENLSKAIGKNNKAIIGVKDINIANQIERINRGEVDGEN